MVVAVGPKDADWEAWEAALQGFGAPCWGLSLEQQGRDADPIPGSYRCAS